MSYGLGDAQGYYGRKPADRAFRSFKACGHSVETRGSDSRYPTHGRLAAFHQAHGDNTCPVCFGEREFRQLQLRFTKPEGGTESRWVSDERHASNLAQKMFREGAAVDAQILVNDVPTGAIWRAAQ